MELYFVLYRFPRRIKIRRYKIYRSCGTSLQSRRLGSFCKDGIYSIQNNLIFLSESHLFSKHTPLK